MTLHGPSSPDGPPPLSEPTLWFLLTLLGGALLLGGLDRIHHLGVAVGAACFAALPIVAAAVAAARLRHH